MIEMSNSEVDDADFRATFSLLPHALKLVRILSTGKADAQTIQKTVSELQTQMQRCHQLLEATPSLNHTPEEQQAHLERMRTQLRQKSELLLKYRDLDILSTGHR